MTEISIWQEGIEGFSMQGSGDLEDDPDMIFFLLMLMFKRELD